MTLTQVEQACDFFDPPSHCPCCDSALAMDGEYLVCQNLDCSAQVMGSLKRWLVKNGVLHFGDALLTAVTEEGMVKTIGDLYRLQEDQFASLEMDGRRVGGMAKRALKSLHSKKEITLDHFVGSLGIPLVGRKGVLLLMKAGFDDLDKLDRASFGELAAVDGFGPTKAASFEAGFASRKNLMLDILAAGVSIKEPEVVQQTGTAMAGQVVCMTGFRDKDMATAIEAAGGEISSGVSKKTTLLVAKDPASTSGKAKKARSQGTEIIGPDAMWDRLGGRP